MIRAELGRQLMLRLNNKVGSLADVTSVISSSKINLVAICAYEVEGMVAVMFVTEDNNETKRLLMHKGYKVQEEEIVLLSIDNKPGALQGVTDRVAKAGINLHLIYGSVDSSAPVSRIVLISDNNLDVMMIIKTELERSS